MFRLRKNLDVITLFHKASSPGSHKVLDTLRQLSLELAVLDSKDSSSKSSTPKRGKFELDVTEELPTSDQLRNIIEYVGKSNLNSIVKGALDEADAFKKLKAFPESIQRPITVDWARGRAVASTNESEILNMINSLPKDIS